MFLIFMLWGLLFFYFFILEGFLRELFINILNIFLLFEWLDNYVFDLHCSVCKTSSHYFKIIYGIMSSEDYTFFLILLGPVNTLGEGLGSLVALTRCHWDCLVWYMLLRRVVHSMLLVTIVNYRWSLISHRWLSGLLIFHFQNLIGFFLLLDNGFLPFNLLIS